MNRHLSPEQITRWIIGERPEEEQQHVRECLQCSAELTRLEHSLSLFRNSGLRWSEHWYAAQSAISVPATAGKQQLSFWRKLTLAGALTASLFIAALAIRRPAQVTGLSSGPFVEIPYVAPLAPYERSEVMRVDLPVAALIAAGFEVHVADAGGAVKADVLVGQDGRAHAIRLLPDSTLTNDRRQQP